MQQVVAQKCVPQSMQDMLREVPLRATGDLRQQERLPVLCQAQDPWKQTQMPLKQVSTALFLALPNLIYVMCNNASWVLPYLWVLLFSCESSPIWLMMPSIIKIDLFISFCGVLYGPLMLLPVIETW